MRTESREWLSIILSGLAILVSLWAAQQAREARLISIRPLVDFYRDDDSGSPTLGVALHNSGPGVAMIKTMRYYVDRKPVSDWPAALKANGFDPDADYGTTFDPGDSLGVGEQVFFIRYRTKDPQVAARFADFIDYRVGILLNYCTVGGTDCRTRCSVQTLCAH